MPFKEISWFAGWAGLALAALLWLGPIVRRWVRRPRMTRFQREILQARMTADDELEYDRIMRAIGLGPHDFRPKGGYAPRGALIVDPPQVDSVALYNEVERRYHAKEISLEQYRSEIGELERTYGPTYRVRR